MEIKKLLEEKKKMLFKKQNMYEIPKRYKIAEREILQDDRDSNYKEMNYKIDKAVGETLQAIYDYESDNYVIGIHKTITSREDIFKKGIEYENGTNIHNHVQLFENFTYMLKTISEIQRGCFIIKVPKISIERSSKDAKPIYYKARNGKIYLRPEYISAYVPVNNKNLGMVEFNPYSHDIYDQTTEFIYDENLNQIKKTY